MALSSEERDFLLAEFNTAWDMVLKIDERRGVFARYYTVLFVAVLTIATNAVSAIKSYELMTYIGLTAIFVFTFISGFVTEKILQSERAANVRYRKKINLIREIMLAGSNDAKIIDYLTHTELGILVHSQKEAQPKGTGQTLTSIYWLIRLQQLAIALCLVGLWAYYVVGPRVLPIVL